MARAYNIFRLGLALAFALCLLGVFGCSSTQVDEHSPRVLRVDVFSSSDMTEQSQKVVVKITFDQAISAKTVDVSKDFNFQLNGTTVDSSTVKLSVQASGEAVTFTLTPANSSNALSGLFAMYQAGFNISSVRSDGALGDIVGMSGSCAVIDEPLEGVLSSGLSIEVVDQVAGSTSTNTLAQTTFTVTSPAKVRAITWFSPDGGITKLLKHNHNFASLSAEGAAEDLAKIVNASNTGLVATAHGADVVLTATQVVDGQVIEPVIVEGPDVTGGEYDGSYNSDGTLASAAAVTK